MNTTDITFGIKKHIATLAEKQGGWTKELNIVSWNEGEDKYDIRDWDPEHKLMSRGITLKPDEMRAAYEALKDEFEGK